MTWRGEVEDGIGWGGLVPSKEERRQEALLRETERRLMEGVELEKMVLRLSFALRSVSLIGGSDSRRTALCDEADALLLRCGRK